MGPVGNEIHMEKRLINGRTITYYVDAPSPSGRRRTAGKEEPAADVPTIVLLHGFPMCGRVWAEVAERLASDYRVLRPNLRGFGPFVESESFSIEDLAADVHLLLHDLGVTPCVIAGLSMGGYVAQAYAERWTEDLKGLGLVNTRSHADDGAARQKREDMIRLAETRGTPAVVSGMHPKMLAPAAYKAKADVGEALLRIMLDTAAHTIVTGAKAMRDRKDYGDVVANLDMPVAVIAGVDDQIIPSVEAEELAETLHDGRLVLLDGVGHISPLEDPQAVATALAALARDAFNTRLATS